MIIHKPYNLKHKENIEPILVKKKEGNRISFVLFGSNPLYSFGTFHNLVLCKKIYPDWTCRIYIDKIDHRCNFFEELEAEVFLVKDKNPPMFWRMYPIDDENVNFVIFRDVDSLLTEREKVAVDEWIESKKLFHRMKENCHFEQLPIMTGMWGINAKLWRSKNSNTFKSLIERYKVENYQKELDNQATPDYLRSIAVAKYLPSLKR